MREGKEKWGVENTQSEQLKKISLSCKTSQLQSVCAAGFTIALLYLVNESSGLCTQWFLNCSEMAQLEMSLDSYIAPP